MPVPWDLLTLLPWVIQGLLHSMLCCCVWGWDDITECQRVREYGAECSGFLLNLHQQCNYKDKQTSNRKDSPVLDTRCSKNDHKCKYLEKINSFLYPGLLNTSRVNLWVVNVSFSVMSAGSWLSFLYNFISFHWLAARLMVSLLVSPDSRAFLFPAVPVSCHGAEQWALRLWSWPISLVFCITAQCCYGVRICRGNSLCPCVYFTYIYVNYIYISISLILVLVFQS